MKLHVPKPRPLTRGQHDKLNLYVARSIRLARTAEIAGPASYELWLLLEWDASIQAVCERPQTWMNTDSARDLPDFWIKPTKRDPYYASLVAADYLIRDATGALVPRTSNDLSGLHRVDGLAMIWIPDAVLRERVIGIRNCKYLLPFATEASLYPDFKLRESALRIVKKRREISWRSLEHDLHEYGTHRVRCEIAFLLHQGHIRTNWDTDLVSDATTLSISP